MQLNPGVNANPTIRLTGRIMLEFIISIGHRLAPLAHYANHNTDDQRPILCPVCHRLLRGHFGDHLHIPLLRN